MNVDKGRRTSRSRKPMRPSMERLEELLLLTAGIESFPTGEITGGARPTSLVSAPDGSLWFTGTYGHIGHITLQGQVTLYPYASGGLGVASDGDVWFGANNWQTNVLTLDKITPSGAVTAIPLPAGVTVENVAVDKLGNVWFTETDSSVVGRYSTDGTFTQFSLPNSPGHIGSSEPITLGSDGKIWLTRSTGFGSNLTATIDRITPDGAVTEFPVATGQVTFSGLTTGSNGNLLFTESVGSTNDPSYTVGQMTTQGTVVSTFNAPHEVGGVTSDAAGNIWFTMPEADEVGRIDGTGQLDIYTITYPGAGAPGPVAIVAGQDGAIWFTVMTPTVIARLDPSVATPDGQEKASYPIEIVPPATPPAPPTSGPQPGVTPLSLTDHISNGSQNAFLAKVLQNSHVASNRAASLRVRNALQVSHGVKHPVATRHAAVPSHASRLTKASLHPRHRG